MNNQDHIRASFARQAKGFNDGRLSLANKEYLDWMVALLPLNPGDDVLDVAAGTGHLSRAIAPRVRCVTAYDITPEMLAEAKHAAMQEGVHNLSVLHGAAEEMPFEADRFDLVVTRFAVHHFVHPQVVMAEMKRVCKPGGFVAVIDLVAPPDIDLAARYNVYECIRDPSHTAALQPSELVDLFACADLRVDRTEAREIEVDVARWLELTHSGEPAIQDIKSAIHAELSGGMSTGLRPFVKDGRLMFWQTWMVVVGHKVAEGKTDDAGAD